MNEDEKIGGEVEVMVEGKGDKDEEDEEEKIKGVRKVMIDERDEMEKSMEEKKEEIIVDMEGN